jgi:hypothetical protein
MLGLVVRSAIQGSPTFYQGTIRTRMPAYVLVILYSVIALLFPDRLNYLIGLVLALVLYVGSWRLGRIINSNLFQLKDETTFLPLGLGIFLIFTYLAGLFSTGFVILLCWIVAALLALFETRILLRHFPRSLIWATPFLLLGFWSSLTPSVFFDALVYHLGLPMQYLLTGKMVTTPYHFFSIFPPFEFVLNLLFVKLNALSGIKVFSILLVFHISFTLANLATTLLKDEVRSEFVVLPLFFLASIWIQIHLITADLLVAMFLISSISTLLKNPAANYPQLFLIAILAAFAAWTKPTALPYIAFMILLWLPFRLVHWNLKKAIYFYAVTLILLSPLFLRNYSVTGDPLYPTFSKNNPNWSNKQQLALQADISAPQKDKLLRFFKAPIEIIYAPFKYGSAAEVGIFYALSAIANLLFWKKHPPTNKLFLFLVFCYAFWAFAFRDFRQFCPIFLLGHVPFAIAIQDLFRLKKWIPILLLAASAIFTVSLLLPVFRNHMPLIRNTQNQEEYLEAKLDYYAFAKWTSSIQTDGRVLMLGESRTAYLHVPVITSTPFDKHPFFQWLSQSNSFKDLQKEFEDSHIQYMMVNWLEYARYAEKCGLLPIDPVPPRFRDAFKRGKARTGLPLAHLNQEKIQILSDFSKQCLVPTWRMGDQYLVWQVRCKEQEMSKEQ